MTNLAGGIQYWGPDQTWVVEVGDGSLTTFSHPITYEDDLDTWHYWRLIVDHSQHRYVSFQFDEDLWDLSLVDALVLPDFFDSSVLPVVDHNVRILEPAVYEGPYTTIMLLDDPMIEVWGG